LLRGDASSGARHNASVRIQELLQDLHVFVVEVADIMLQKKVFHKNLSYFVG
jgi:hypothetical protein